MNIIPNNNIEASPSTGISANEKNKKTISTV